MIPKEMKEMNIRKYRITSDLKVETDIINSIVAIKSIRMSSDISDNVC